jgi:hypothetical protein
MSINTRHHHKILHQGMPSGTSILVADSLFSILMRLSISILEGKGCSSLYYMPSSQHHIHITVAMRPTSTADFAEAIGCTKATVVPTKASDRNKEERYTGFQK